MRLPITTACSLVLLAASPGPAAAIFLPADIVDIPVDRLITNLERRVKAAPDKAGPHITLARAHAVAFARKAGVAQVMNPRIGRIAKAPKVEGSDVTPGEIPSCCCPAATARTSGDTCFNRSPMTPSTAAMSPSSRPRPASTARSVRPSRSPATAACAASRSLRRRRQVTSSRRA